MSTQRDRSGVSYAAQKLMIYDAIAELLKDKGLSLDRAEARKVFDLVIRQVFESAVEHGSFNLSDGMGKLELVEGAQGLKRLPGGVTQLTDSKIRLKFRAGITTNDLIETKRDKSGIRQTETRRMQLQSEGVECPDDMIGD